MQFNTKLDKDTQYWITSDLHFGHKNIMKFCPKTRPFNNVEHMDEKLIGAWNDSVGTEDVVFVLGDFSFHSVGRTRAIMQRLNGTAVWILGNHDKSLEQVLQQDSIPYTRYLEVRLDGVKVCMMHYALRAWNQAHRGSVMLYGHSHGGMPDFGRSTDIGWDAQGDIVDLRHIVGKLLKRDIETQDGH